MVVSLATEMSTVSYTVFDTPIGHCALVWHEAAIVGVQLPEGSAAATVTSAPTRLDAPTGTSSSNTT